MDLTRRLLAPALALALLAGGCSGDDEDDVPPDPAESAGASVRQQRAAALDVSLARVSGSLPKAAARDLTRRLGRVVATWVNGGFLPGDYPRKSFAGYAAFTPGAARLARRHVGITTNLRLGRRWVEVVPTRQRVRLYVFAPGRRPSGATARVELVLAGADADGTVSELAVTGDLYLTRTASGWRIFGFDLNRSVGRPGSYAAQHRRATRPGAESGKPDHEPRERDDQGTGGSR